MRLGAARTIIADTIFAVEQCDERWRQHRGALWGRWEAGKARWGGGHKGGCSARGVGAVATSYAAKRAIYDITATLPQKHGSVHPELFHAVQLRTRSVLLMISMSDCVTPGPPLRGTLSPPDTCTHISRPF